MLFAAPTDSSSDALNTFVHLLAKVWWLWALVGLMFAGRFVRFLWLQRRLRHAGVHDIDRMDGTSFEHRLGVLFRALGYRVELTGSARGDYGGDLLVSKDGTRTIVQAKCWKKNVGVKAVQEAVGARGFYRTDGAIVVTNRYFSQQARKLAHANDVRLWDREELVRALLNTAKHAAAPEVTRSVAALSPEQDPLGVMKAAEPVGVAVAAPAVAEAGAFCARCGDAVTERVRRYCLARPKRFSGLVYCYEHQRSL
jgi:restriction system protein